MLGNDKEQSHTDLFITTQQGSCFDKTSEKRTEHLRACLGIWKAGPAIAEQEAGKETSSPNGHYCKAAIPCGMEKQYTQKTHKSPLQQIVGISKTFFSKRIP